MKTNFRNNCLLTFLVILYATFNVQAALPEIPQDPSAAELWKSRRMLTIKEAQAKTNEEKIPQLAEMLRQLKSLGYRESPEKNYITQTIQDILLSTSGHAKYYENQIETLREEVLANSKRTEEELDVMKANGVEIHGEADYETVRFDAFKTLAFLPSVETVSVLGYYLNDPVGLDGKTLLGNNQNGSDYHGLSGNASMAVTAISNLGIDRPPVPQKAKGNQLSPTPEEIDAWKNWWNEIAAGKRTYRFIGSPVEYGPDGPVSKEKLERIKLSEKRDEERKSGVKSQSSQAEAVSQSKQPRTWAGIGAACLLAAGAIAYYVKSKKAA